MVPICYRWWTRNYGSKQLIPRAQPEGEVCLRRHNSLATMQSISNLYPKATELTARSAILIGCCSLGYSRYGLLVSNGSVQSVRVYFVAISSSVLLLALLLLCSSVVIVGLTSEACVKTMLLLRTDWTVNGKGRSYLQVKRTMDVDVRAMALRKYVRSYV